MSRTYRQTAYKELRPKSIREHRQQSKRKVRHNNLDALDFIFDEESDTES